MTPQSTCMKALNLIYPIFIMLLLLYTYMYEMIACEWKLDIIKDTIVSLMFHYYMYKKYKQRFTRHWESFSHSLFLSFFLSFSLPLSLPHEAPISGVIHIPLYHVATIKYQKRKALNEEPWYHHKDGLDLSKQTINQSHLCLSNSLVRARHLLQVSDEDDPSFCLTDEDDPAVWMIQKHNLDQREVTLAVSSHYGWNLF